MRIAALDLGSNSFHLLAADAHADGTFVPLLKDKEMLRLGDCVARNGRIPAEEADAAVATVRRFRALADSAECEEIVACATSAIREADNGGDIVDRIAEEAGVDVRVISGRDEARLIFGAIRASVVLDPGPALCLDLGGGSLEVMVGDAAGLRFATSLKLGVARLSAACIRNDPPSKGDLRRVTEKVTETLQPLLPRIRDLEPRLAVGSSGTFCDLARMVAAARGGPIPDSINQFSMKRDELVDVHKKIAAATTAERRRMDGLEARRAELVVAGSTLITTVLGLFGLDEFAVSEWALREGIILDAIGHHDAADWSGDPRALRVAAVESLARRCSADEVHARQVAVLATSLFDQTQELHGLGPDDRELLEHAAVLHDIGEHVSEEGHQKHTAYLIQHGRLRGFDPDEVNMLAALGRYHRNGEPKPSHEHFGALDDDRRERVTKLAALLRVADGLDRGHNAVVTGVNLDVGKKDVRITVEADGDAELELWGGRRKRALFEKLFDRHVDVVAG